MSEEHIRAAMVSPQMAGLSQAPDLPWDEFYKTGKYELNEAQKECIRQIVWTNGGPGVLSVGKGKSLLAFILPTVFGISAADVMLLHPKNAEKTLRLQYAKFEPHMKICMPNMVSYEIFQNALYSRRFGKTIKPKMIICDESQGLKAVSSTRFRRLMSYIVPNQGDVMFIPLTATASSMEIQEYAHIWAAALRDLSPLPAAGNALVAWGRMFNSRQDPAPRDWPYLEPFFDRYDPEYGERAKIHFYEDRQEAKEYRRALLKQHLEQAPGVTIKGEASVGVPLYLSLQEHIGIPEKIQKIMKYMKENKRLPAEGDFFESASIEAKAMVEILHGFYYKWEWDDSVSNADKTDWKLARSDWNKTVRRWMDAPEDPELNSPFLFEQALRENPHGFGRRAWENLVAWDEVQKRVTAPRTVGVWVDDYLIDWVRKWVNMSPPALLWYGPVFFGEHLKLKLGVPVYDAGNPPPEEGEAGTGDHTAGCRLTHRQALNLQAWEHHLVITPPGSGGVWEQLLGRSHRQGAKSDIRVDIVAHHKYFKKRVDQSIVDAEFADQHQGVEQKLLYGYWV